MSNKYIPRLISTSLILRDAVRVCKIGDHDLNQNIVDSKATITLLRLRSIAKVEYKLISSPSLGRPDQLLKL
jgi:hypothetical protein